MSDGASPRGLPLLSGPPPPTPGERAEASCRKCNKEFNILFTRSKKCNHCGYSYCSSCADYQALMPRSGSVSGYDAASVCAFCIELLSSKAQLKALPLAKLRKYVDAYNIQVKGPIDKLDLVDAIVAARGATGCLPPENEDYYRKNSVPRHGATKPRGLFTRMQEAASSSAPRPPPTRGQTPSSTSNSGPSFARPDLDPNYRPRTAPPPQQPRPQPQYRPYVPPPRPPNVPRPQQGSRPTTAYGSPNSNVPPQQPRFRTTSVPPTPAPQPAPPPAPTPTLDELLLMSPERISALSIGTLKAILWDNHVNARLILEKGDLVVKVNTLVDDERRERERKRREDEEEAERERLAKIEAEEEARQKEEAARVEREQQEAQATAAPADGDIDMSEEAVALEGDTVPPPTPPKVTPKAPMSAAVAERHGLCVICQDEEANIAIVDCGHLAMCRPCSELVMTTSRECPLCRTRIITEARLLRIFKT
ncbi:hypothetical protein BV22DRAFT_634493 [Leucogyrophana mollusca]|uniref:Uncharacterized protein n=1 Tax=Leucogyrophana mollusca TaxID=85980 RepID=A0ACB8BD38_9AGAM|nr:hypothetical protein BV22DRAFT_634493 [Leucogyrophana mollusca]